MINRGFVRARRLDLGFTQNGCARMAGLSGGNYWSDIEQGRRTGVTARTACRMANVLGCRVEDLLTEAAAGTATEEPRPERDAVHSFSWPPARSRHRPGRVV